MGIKKAKPVEAPVEVKIPVLICQTVDQFMSAPAPTLTSGQSQAIKEKLRQRPCPFFTEIAQPPYTRWKLPDGLGEITTIKHPDMPFPSIYAIWGKGYGSQMVKALVSHYGGLTSDPTGNTSGDAQRMWERLGAEQVPSKNPNGFYYLLRA